MRFSLYFLPLFLLLFFTFQKSNGQDISGKDSNPKTSVEKSIFGAELGLGSFTLFNEVKLGENFTLKASAGLQSTLIVRNSYNDFKIGPIIELQPRWYYNLQKRAEKGKNIFGNSGNYFGLTTAYQPDWFSWVGDSGADEILNVGLVWGLKRQFAKHLLFEFYIGPGYHYTEYEKQFPRYDNGFSLMLGLKIGYQF